MPQPARGWCSLLKYHRYFPTTGSTTGLLLPKPFRTTTNLPYVYQHTLSNTKHAPFGIKPSLEAKYSQGTASLRTHSTRLLQQAAPCTGWRAVSPFKPAFWGEFLQFLKCSCLALPFLPDCPGSDGPELGQITSKSPRAASREQDGNIKIKT